MAVELRVSPRRGIIVRRIRGTAPAPLPAHGRVAREEADGRTAGGGGRSVARDGDDRRDETRARLRRRSPAFSIGRRRRTRHRSGDDRPTSSAPEVRHGSATDSRGVRRNGNGKLAIIPLESGDGEGG